jgi:hypothetical protein
MHQIEFDGSAPSPAAPWKVTTDDGAEFHAATELDAAERLTAWIEARQARDSQPASLPAGARVF